MKSARVRLVLASIVALAFPLVTSAQSPELRILQVQYDNAVIDRVTDVYNAALRSLEANYTAGLDRGLSDATAAGDLEGALSLQAEKKRIASKEPLPANDEQASKPLRKLRGIYRVELAKLDAQRATNQAAVLTPHLEKLKQLESDLTKATRLSDAKAVMDYRQGLAAGVPMKGTGTVVPSSALTSTPPTPPSSFSPPPAGGFTNTLGMKFVPVPDTKVLFCIHPTRVKDYAAYSAEVQGVNESWKKMVEDNEPISDKDDDPVVGVSWEDAQGFCAWLSKKEGRLYRLPADRDWSYAVGIGAIEKASKGATPKMLSKKIDNVYPWGSQWPPPRGAGNFVDTASIAKFPKLKALEGYTDGFPATSPVMSFKPNKCGLYDMVGNVFQWCEDFCDETEKQRVLRGSPWRENDKGYMLSSNRICQGATTRRNHFGFRIVVESSAR